MDQYGNTYAVRDSYKIGIAHSSIVAGGPVAGAGEFRVENGIVTFISNKSGHYVPPWPYIQQVAEEWSTQGLSFRRVRFEIFENFRI